ncbi:MAG: type II toxin-antitoxin system death-on-curing family toxin [Terricaulis sp.]
MKAPTWVERAAALLLHDESIALHGGLAGVRDMGLLESALARSQNLFAYGEGDEAALAAAYAFGIIKNHPFVDGNKRTGFLAAALFLEANGFRFVSGETEAVVQTLSLAAGAIEEGEFAAWLRDNIQSC